MGSELRTWSRRRYLRAHARRTAAAHGRVMAVIVNRPNLPTQYFGTYLVPYYGRLRVNQGLAIVSDSDISIDALKTYGPIDLKAIDADTAIFDAYANDVGLFMHKVFR